MTSALRTPRGPVRRQVVVAAGAAGLLIAGVFSTVSRDARPGRQPAPQAAKLAGTARASSPGAAAVGTRLLDQAATAARLVPYQGVQLISWLAPGARASWLGSGPDRVEVSHRSGQPPAVVLGLSPALVGLLHAHYVAVYIGQGAAAGRAASVVEVRRRDGSIAARFWLDDATKLPLRREIFGSRARVISVDDLADLKVGTPPAGGAAKAVAPSPDRPAPAASTRPPVTTSQPRNVVAREVTGIADEMATAGFAIVPLASASPASGAAAAQVTTWADRLGRRQLATLRAEGWPVPAALAGDLTLCGASETTTSSGRIVHLAYSDGLSVISLFLQRGQLPASLPGWRRTELSGHRVYLRNPAEPDLAWSAGGYVFTVVAGAPAPVIASVVNSLPHQARPGFWARMDRGMRRVFSWINPFG